MNLSPDQTQKVASYMAHVAKGPYKVVAALDGATKEIDIMLLRDALACHNIKILAVSEAARGDAHVIRGNWNDDDQDYEYWSSEGGFGSYEAADIFLKTDVNLPIGGSFVTVEQVHEEWSMPAAGMHI